MFKKLCSVFGVGMLLATGASAQIFNITPNDTIEVNTTGQGELTDEGFTNTLDVNGYVNNISGVNQAFFKWQLLSDSTEHPLGWVLTGICDNVQCRAPYSPFYYHEVQETFQVTANNKTLMEARIYVPVASANGTGVFRIKIWSVDQTDMTTPTQIDTLVIIVNKTATSIASISVNDNRVKTYPNPVQNQLQVYTDKSLSATSISVFDITGKMQGTTAVNSKGTTTDVDTRNLSKGIYLLKVTDAQGQLITTRKFTKN